MVTVNQYTGRQIRTAKDAEDAEKSPQIKPVFLFFHLRALCDLCGFIYRGLNGLIQASDTNRLRPW